MQRYACLNLFSPESGYGGKQKDEDRLALKRQKNREKKRRSRARKAIAKQEAKALAADAMVKKEEEVKEANVDNICIGGLSIGKSELDTNEVRLFEQPPPKEDCPICIIRLPTLVTGRRYMSCCGKLLCSGCVYAPVYDHRGNIVKKRRCPFCRAPYPTSVKENIQRYKKRVEMGDAAAMQKVGECYSLGKCGLPQDMTKALELWHQAAELGCAEAYLAVGYAYYNGKGVEIDKKKANHYYELAAMGGNEIARFNLSGIEEVLAILIGH